MASAACLRGGLLELRGARAEAVALRHQHAQHRALAAARGAWRRPPAAGFGPRRRTSAQHLGMACCARALRDLDLK